MIGCDYIVVFCAMSEFNACKYSNEVLLEQVEGGEIGLERLLCH